MNPDSKEEVGVREQAKLDSEDHGPTCKTSWTSRARRIPSSSDFWALARQYCEVRNNTFPVGTFPPWYQDDEAFIRAFMKTMMRALASATTTSIVSLCSTLKL